VPADHRDAATGRRRRGQALVALYDRLFSLGQSLMPVVALAALPIALWELSLGIWLTVKGFRPSTT
jgi:hypothetical protein